MNKKKAQFGLDTLASYLVFGTFLLFTIIALNISGCGSSKKRVEVGLESDTGVIAELRASEQLSAYLRTDMPDKGALIAKILSLEGKESIKDGIDSLNDGINTGNAISFLEQRPEVYVGKTYGGFISALYVHKDDNEVKNVFNTVTRAMFYRKLFTEDARAGTGRAEEFYEFYSTPYILVKYGRHKGFMVDDWDLASAVDYLNAPAPSAAAILPTYDKTGLTVQLHLYREGRKVFGQPVSVVMP